MIFKTKLDAPVPQAPGGRKSSSEVLVTDVASPHPEVDRLLCSKNWSPRESIVQPI